METAVGAPEFWSRHVTDAEQRRGLVRDVHDVVGNAMTAINLQAKLALRTLEQRPAETAEALRAIASSSQRSLHELRSILGAAQRTDAPVATLAQLETLIETTVAGQIDVEIDVTGDLDTLPATHGAAAYRIVQESLTNVLRHANATSIRVVVSVESDTLTVEITDDGERAAEPPVVSGHPGHGIRGMRERAGMLGGDLSAGPNQDSGFCVRGRLPLPHTRPEGDHHGH
ncbi:MAG: hypothetical protein QOJ13_2473 [Gaiellales bacterium]|jgi:signal transduction histidine kinase|nr:hypothetical protein [Gaiellales bacterium]